MPIRVYELPISFEFWSTLVLAVPKFLCLKFFVFMIFFNIFPLCLSLSIAWHFGSKESIVFLLCIHAWASKARSKDMALLAPLGVCVLSFNPFVLLKRFGRKSFGFQTNGFVALQVWLLVPAPWVWKSPVAWALESYIADWAPARSCSFTRMAVIGFGLVRPLSRVLIYFR